MNKLRAYRKLFDLTQSEMAEIAGMGLTSYNQKEQGKLDFTRSEMVKITSYFKAKNPNITAEEIFFADEVFKMKTESCN